MFEFLAHDFATSQLVSEEAGDCLQNPVSITKERPSLEEIIAYGV